MCSESEGDQFGRVPEQFNPFTDTVSKIKGNIYRIKKLIYEGKSVTKANKQLIFTLAEGINPMLKELCQLAKDGNVNEKDNPELFTAFIDEKTTLAIKQTMKEEFGKLAKQHLNLTKQTIAPKPTYAEAAKTKESTTPINTSNPAIIVSAPEAKTARDTLSKWKRSISFKSGNYAPARVQPLSGNKIRVEFDTSNQRDETLGKLRDNKDIQVEAARKLRPMMILKGIHEETPVEELTDIIKNQNETIKNSITQNDDIIFCFKRTNKNPKLYNAVFKMAPSVWRCAMNLERINVDHQKIHKEEYSPFVQCYDCLQFGHTRAKCTSSDKVCSHCSSSQHLYKECPLKTKSEAKQCYNCTMYNKKYKLNRNTEHGATSNECSTIKAMKNKIRERTEYA